MPLLKRCYCLHCRLPGNIEKDSKVQCHIIKLQFYILYLYKCHEYIAGHCGIWHWHLMSCKVLHMRIYGLSSPQRAIHTFKTSQTSSLATSWRLHRLCAAPLIQHDSKNSGTDHAEWEGETFLISPRRVGLKLSTEAESVKTFDNYFPRSGDSCQGRKL